MARSLEVRAGHDPARNPSPAQYRPRIRGRGARSFPEDRRAHDALRKGRGLAGGVNPRSCALVRRCVRMLSLHLNQILTLLQFLSQRDENRACYKNVRRSSFSRFRGTLAPISVVERTVRPLLLSGQDRAYAGQVREFCGRRLRSRLLLLRVRRSDAESSAAVRMAPRGLARPLPAMSGVEPWTGSYRLLCRRWWPGQHAERAGDYAGLVGKNIAEKILCDVRHRSRAGGS